jgi:hypothetical protein
MADSTTFSSRSNAKRAADTAIGKGTVPNVDYEIHPRDDGRFEIVWLTRGVPPTTDEAPDEEQALEETPAKAADPFPKGARVRVRGRKNRANGTTFTGTVDYRVDANFYRVFVDGARGDSALYRTVDISPSDAPALAQEAKTGKPERKPRAAPSGDRKPSKNAELDAAAARGEMPTKPIMTSPTNKAQYQPRFDKLEAMATAGDWDGVRGYEVKGINSYAKMVKQYRERLLTAHAASTSRPLEAAARRRSGRRFDRRHRAWLLCRRNLASALPLHRCKRR